MLKQPKVVTVFIPRMTEVCQECGCNCHSCFTGNSLDLHHEIEELRSKLIKSQNYVTQMERDLGDSREYAENEVTKLQDELIKLRDRYDRLFESHKKLQKLNHNLEDKLLTLVGQFNREKDKLVNQVGTLSSDLRDAKILICDLEEECEKYRNDCNVAVQLLQNDPSHFVGQKLTTLPLDLQHRVKSHLTRQQLQELDESPDPSGPPSPKMIRVPMQTFPPTAMVYSVPRPADPSQNSEQKKEPNNTVPTKLIAKVLAQPETTRKPRRVYICDKCRMDYMFVDESTQTLSPYNSDYNSFHRQLPMSNKYPQSAILIQPTVHSGRPRMNSTETEI